MELGGSARVEWEIDNFFVIERLPLPIIILHYEGCFGADLETIVRNLRGTGDLPIKSNAVIDFIDVAIADDTLLELGR